MLALFPLAPHSKERLQRHAASACDGAPTVRLPLTGCAQAPAIAVRYRDHNPPCTPRGLLAAGVQCAAPPSAPSQPSPTPPRATPTWRRTATTSLALSRCPRRRGAWCMTSSTSPGCGAARPADGWSPSSEWPRGPCCAALPLRAATALARCLSRPGLSLAHTDTQTQHITHSTPCRPPASCRASRPPPPLSPPQRPAHYHFLSLATRKALGDAMDVHGATWEQDPDAEDMQQARGGQGRRAAPRCAPPHAPSQRGRLLRGFLAGPGVLCAFFAKGGAALLLLGQRALRHRTRRRRHPPPTAFTPLLLTSLPPP
jgi:hypothetical protein